MTHESRVKRIDGTRTAGAKHRTIERRQARQLKRMNGRA